ncbi:hypothetical protein BsWGS_17133 [Bradybaena similaris]
MAEVAAPQPDSAGALVSETATAGRTSDEVEADEDSRMENSMGQSMRDKDRKIGHRRVDKSGIVSYKKKPTSELMAAIQLGIGQSVGGLSAKPERDVLMQDFGVVEVVFFPGEGSNLTPAHHYSDFRFKTYAPVAFRYFRDLFGIQPDDFMLSLCDEPLKELSNPGASGSIFYLTQDDEFIIKTVQHKEAEFLQTLLPGYFLNISQNKRTLLPKFYGLFCYQCGGKNIRFTVMNNLLPSTVKLHERYDMKGSTYKRKASKHERLKSSPTLKDLDFMENHPDGLILEKDTYDALVKTLQRDCRVLESFKIMDYSLLIGIYNIDQAKNEPPSVPESTSFEQPSVIAGLALATGSHFDPHMAQNQTGLQRGKSFKTRIGQYTTPLESIQGNTELTEDLNEDEDVPPGGIPARNIKGERLLLYLGIIDILQSFRLKKRLEHTVKSMVIDGDTISVHRPSYYAHRFLQYHATRVFRKASVGLKPSPSKKRSISKPRLHSEQSEVYNTFLKSEKTGKTILFQDPPVSAASSVGERPDLLPEYSKVPTNDSRYSSPSRPLAYNVNGNSRHLNRSEPANLSMYGSEDGLSMGTASTASLRGVGVSSSSASHRVPSPSLSLSESTPTHTEFTEGTPSFTNSSLSSCSDLGSTSVLDATGMHSPARSPAPSPDFRYSNRRGRMGAASPLTRPSHIESTGSYSPSLTMAEPRQDVKLQVTPDSPPTKEIHLSEAQTTTVTVQTAVTSATAELLAAESETTKL